MQLFNLQGGLSGLQGQPGAGAPTSRMPQAPARLPAQGPGDLSARTLPGLNLRTGQVLFGQVTGRQPDGGLLLRLGGQTMTADARVPLEVGQQVQVQVQGQQQGQWQLQVVRTPFQPMSSQDLGQALARLNLPMTEGNVALAASMVEHGIPLTKENFTFLKAALAQAPAENLPAGAAQAQAPGGAAAQPGRVGAAWFLQSNQLPVTGQNISTLASFVAANPQLGQQLFALQGELRRLASSPQRQSSRSLELLAQVPGLLGEVLLDPPGRSGGGKSARRLFDLARQAGIETHLGLQGGGDQDWDLVSAMRDLRAALAGDAAGLEVALGLMEDLEQNLQALRLINQATPDAGLGFYYLQVPLRQEPLESAEIWIRYRVEDEAGRVVDPGDLRIEFLISTENLGDLFCTLEVVDRTVHVDLGSHSEEVRAWVEGYLPVLVERLAAAGWTPGRVGATQRPFGGHSLVERRDFQTLESVNVQA